jgi:hypothetical protein
MITEIVIVPPPIRMTKSWLKGIEDGMKYYQAKKKPSDQPPNIQSVPGSPPPRKPK